MNDPRFAQSVPKGKTWGVNFGGGVNSTALLLFIHDRDERPDWVLFADTGSERPETYKNIEVVEKWCKKVGFPFATTRWIRKDGTFESIHENALRTSYLPSKAYGLAGCTYKWKSQPMERWRKANGFEGGIVAIGYDAGESRRIEKLVACSDTDRLANETYWYPLVAWGIDRRNCIARIEAQGWKTVKSACFCCPNMRPGEWDALRTEHPDLYEIADRIEGQAKAAGNATSASLFRAFSPDQTCFCFADGCSVPEPSDETK